MFQGINILKAHGKSARDSFLMNGYALNTGRAAQGMPLRVAPAKIACLDFNLQKTKMQLGVQVLVTDPRELEKIRQRYCQYDQMASVTMIPNLPGFIFFRYENKLIILLRVIKYTNRILDERHVVNPKPLKGLAK